MSDSITKFRDDLFLGEHEVRLTQVLTELTKPDPEAVARRQDAKTQQRIKVLQAKLLKLDEKLKHRFTETDINFIAKGSATLTALATYIQGADAETLASALGNGAKHQAKWAKATFRGGVTGAATYTALVVGSELNHQYNLHKKNAIQEKLMGLKLMGDPKGAEAVINGQQALLETPKKSGPPTPPASGSSGSTLG